MSDKAVTECSTDATTADATAITEALAAAMAAGTSLVDLAQRPHADEDVGHFVCRLADAVGALPSLLARVNIIALEDTLGSGKSSMIQQTRIAHADVPELIVASEWYDLCPLYGFDAGLVLVLPVCKRELFILAVSVMNMAEVLAENPHASWVVQDRSLISVIWQWGDQSTRDAFEWMFHAPPESVYPFEQTHFILADLPAEETRRSVRRRGRLFGEVTEEEYYFREVDGVVWYDEIHAEFMRYEQRLRQVCSNVFVCHGRRERQALLTKLLSHALTN